MQAHKRVVDKPITEVREAGICMRENSFYVDSTKVSPMLTIFTFLINFDSIEITLASSDGLWIKAPTPPTITPGFYGRVG